MMQSPKKHHWLVYAVPVLVFLAISMIYFAPQFEGETLEMHDLVQYKGASAENDRHYEEYGEDPQWTDSMFGGMPSYMVDFRMPTWIIRHASKLPAKLIGEPAVLMFLVMLCFWLMCLLWKINPWVGLITALAYGLSTYTLLIIGAGHISKVWAMAWAPLLVGAIVYTYRSGNLWFGGALAALAASLEISANHPQIAYYFLLVIAALAANELVRAYRKKTMARFWKASGVLAVAAVIAVGSNAGTLYYTAHHTPDTTRGVSELTPPEGTVRVNQRGLDLEYATAWSYGVSESFNMFIPNFKGGASGEGFSADGPVAQALSQYGARGMARSLPAYWGDQPFTAGPTYIGAVVFFLAAMAMVLLEGRRKWWILTVSIFALFLSWGHNMMWFTELCFRILPGYNKFRAVSTALVILQWAMPLLAALILMQMWKAKVTKERMLHGLKWSAITVGGLALLFALFGGKLFGFESEYDYPRMYDIAVQSGFGEAGSARFADDTVSAMALERASMMRADAWRSLLFVALSGGVVLLFALGRMKRGVMTAILGVLVCLDLALVDTRYLSWDNFVPERQVTVQPTDADREIMADTEPGFRVANFAVSTFNDATTSFFHRSVGGYHGAKLQRYQDLIDRHLGQMNMEVYNMLNTKYFIVPDEAGRPQAQLNPDANGAAWFVDSVTTVDNADGEIAALDAIDTKREAVIDKRFAPMLENATVTADSTASISLTDYKVNHLTYEYRSATGGVAVFSEVYYDKGWTAYIDGQAAPYFRADYILRAMALPAGEHTVEFRFRAPHFAAVSAMTLICSLAILICFAVAAIMLTIRKKQAATPIHNS